MSEHALTIAGVEFRVDFEGDLEVTITDADHNGYDAVRWLKRDQAVQLRDMLNRWLEQQ